MISLSIPNSSLVFAVNSSCGKKVRKHLMQHLLYCYEIGDLDQEFEELEETMRNEGLLLSLIHI